MALSLELRSKGNGGRQVSRSPLPQPCSREPLYCERLKLQSLYPEPEGLNCLSQMISLINGDPHGSEEGHQTNLLAILFLLQYLLTVCNSTTNGHFLSAIMTAPSNLPARFWRLLKHHYSKNENNIHGLILYSL